MNRPGAEPAPPAVKADVAPAAVKADTAPSALKAETAPAVPKPTRDPRPKVVAKTDSKPGASKDGALPKGPTARTPKTERKTTLPPDLAHLQGQWSVVEQTNAAKVSTKEDLARTKPAWEFDGNKMTVRNHGDAPGLVYFQGNIKLHPDLSPKTFDFTGKNRADQAVEMLGIYAFEGPVLVLRFRVHRIGEGAKPYRPDSLKIKPDPKAGSLVRLRRVKQ
jgi:uncharacterized protein (TIGR03067 family)